MASEVDDASGLYSSLVKWVRQTLKVYHHSLYNCQILSSQSLLDSLV